MVCPRTRVLSLLFAVSLSGCGTMNGLSCKGGEQFAVLELLYFGTEKPSGRVTSQDWARFLGDTVTPRFPDGLTAWQASGQWRSAGGSVIQEPSYVLSLVHPNDAAADAAVRELVASYKVRFQQEAVLRVKSYACMSL